MGLLDASFQASSKSLPSDKLNFSANASDAETVGFFRAVGKVARDLGVDVSGYRLIANHGPDSHQLVPHFHVHILGGESLGTGLIKRQS